LKQKLDGDFCAKVGATIHPSKSAFCELFFNHKVRELEDVNGIRINELKKTKKKKKKKKKKKTKKKKKKKKTFISHCSSGIPSISICPSKFGCTPFNSSGEKPNEAIAFPVGLIGLIGEPGDKGVGTRASVPLGMANFGTEQ
jgi:hypothetical protein